MGQHVELEVTNSGVATIRLDRPKVNALNQELVREIGEACDSLGGNQTARAVVVWGGRRVFAAGADIKEMQALDPVGMQRYITGFQSVFSDLESLPQVTIAAINGYALGGGCELALACDLRVCAKDARLGQPEILLGVIPGAGGTQRLPRLIGVGRAKELIYSGRHVDADEALASGLVNEIVAPDDVYTRAVGLAERYAAGPSLALSAAKRAIHAGGDVDIVNGLLIERQEFAGLFASEDQKTGMAAFLEHGPGKAEFSGR
ncbi:enoyl-CoA hydratase-related protein [soil metagenome]